MWSELAALIGVAPRHAEAALYSERAARASLSRRGLFSASAALAVGIAFGFPVSERRQVFLGGEWYDVFEFPIVAPGGGRIVYRDTDSVVITYDLVSKYPESLLAP